jgi:multidrug efflux pump subunit AcrA (membrane-fusion protein)
MIIEQHQANDTLVIALNKPSKALRTTYYCFLALIAGTIVWASLSVVDIAVHAQGFIRPETGMQNVISPTTAYIAHVYVQENQSVKAGDTIAVLETEPLREREKLSQERLRRTASEMADLQILAEYIGEQELGVVVKSTKKKPQFHFPMYEREYSIALKERENILAELGILKSKDSRNRELSKREFVSKEEVEQTTNLVNQKELALKQWQQERLKNIYERLQRAELASLEGNSELKSLSIEKERSVLRAPINGSITQLNFKTSQTLVNAGASFCSISPNDEQIAEFYIPAKDIGFVKEGLNIRYQIDAFSFQEWGIAHGTIRAIAKDYVLNEQHQQAMFKVTGTLSSLALHSHRQQKDARLKPGMSFRAGVVIAQKRVITMLWDRTTQYFAL